ncbi:MAG: HU family DNA-binding protein [Pseudomonadota bacterium]
MAARQDLINTISKNNPDLAPKDVAIAVDIVWNSIAEELENGNRIEIRGFGSFSIRNRKFSPNSSLSSGKTSAESRTVKSVYYRMPQNILERINR